MARIDSVYLSNVVMDSLHHLVHRGAAFTASDFTTGVASGNDVDILFQTTSPVHIAVVNLGVGSDATVTTYEGTTFSAAGTTLPTFNKNRLSSNVSVTTLTTGPTVTTPGTRLSISFLPGGGFLGGGTVSAGNFDEFILNRNTNYMLRITNESAGAIDVGFNIVFYEITRNLRNF